MEVVEAEEQTRTMRHTLTETTEQFQRLSAEKRLRALEFEKRSSALTIARERLNAIDHELRAVREALSLARDQRSQKEIEKARLSSDLEHLVQTCYTELGENIAEICERLDQLLLAPPSSETDEETTSGTSSLPSGQREKSSSSLSDAASTNKRVGGTDEQPEDSEEDDLVPKEEITFWRVPENFDLAAAKVQLDELRKKIDALGPVNMMALEELAEVEDRFEFLVTQKADIESAIAHTQSAIAEIKRRSREKFVEAFYAINENFKAMFLELFGGGHGEMRLIDETDVLESGIEIIAQPPGKRLQNVLLLSGGEKAMAALSLVMAIFKYRPSPFCLLDEVDAPLDDVNIGRFSDKVVEMSVDTQFMIITHSKRTMEAARSLYGVTMEDPGVSKLISVRLS
jgi:chromosome segregation protein